VSDPRRGPTGDATDGGYGSVVLVVVLVVGVVGHVVGPGVGVHGLVGKHEAPPLVPPSR
jgi:hypothetical protein